MNTDPPPVQYRTLFLTLLFAINLFNYVDRMVISGLLEPIGKDLHLTDAQLGCVAISFLIPYSFLPVFIGWIGDRTSRCRLTALAIGLWSVATGVAGLARGLIMLMTTRAVVGVGEATNMTTAPSLIADVFPKGMRARAMAFFFSASPVGAALGVFLAGVIGARFGWRIACMMVGLPGILLAYAMSRYPEPVRGGLDLGIESQRPPLRLAVRELLRNKGFILLILAFSAQVFAYNPVEFWVPTLLQREKAIPMLQANTIFGIAVLLGGFFGPLTGGFVADFLAKRWRHAYFWVSATSAIGLVVPLFAIATAGRGNFLMSGIFVAVVFGNMSVALIMAILVGAVMPGLRATATAVLLISCHLLGDAISQPLIGRVSTTLQSSPGALIFLRHLGAILQIPPQNYLSLAFVAVTLPAAVFSTILFLLAIPGSIGQRSASA